ncbi:hypothetical protein [Longimicrobium terrae]|uniref:6-bladed beta-propeller n=1 Tax=Longimicrobium terrae TaxID=1639882 RepID=A0A841GZE1_9BACT|nr:hypothetical protein [Longimicrobium terrae]MBB4636905.1 hypothetical protein [Longimicrobium terrae]MBB6071096.1 hypothetical protein [Longimicrobium terrae]NNC29145.1 hypothetical protein [Longimicrobium terrae]
MTSRLARLSAAGLFAAACGGASDAALTTTVRDSAGIRIVENRGAPPPLGWSVNAQPALDIGAQGPGTELYQVMAAVRTPRGQIIVANAGTSQVRIYSPDGRLVRSTGRRGSGPGEFESLFWVGALPGDSIAAWDAGLGRLTVLSPAGDVVRVVTPREPLGMFAQAAGVLPDGRLIVAGGSAPSASASPEPRVRRHTVTYTLLGRTGEASPLGRFPGTEMLTMTPAGGGFLMRPLPFGRQTVVAVQNGMAVVGTADRDEVTAYEPGRGARGIVRLGAQPVPVTKDDIAAYRRSLVTLGMEGDATFQRQQELLLDKAPYPRTMPAYTALLSDPEGISGPSIHAGPATRSRQPGR